MNPNLSFPKIWPLPALTYQPFSSIEEEAHVAVFYSQPAYQVVKDRLPFDITWEVEVKDATLQHWDKIQEEFRGETIYSVGGGLAADAAKYTGATLNLPVVCLPTALSVDAFFTWASGIRVGGCVEYIETKPPDKIVIDLQTLAEAPPAIRAAAICDVLSIATGVWDWQFAEEQGANPPGMKFLPWAADAARAILHGALDCAEAAGQGDPSGLKQLIDCLALEVQLCNQLGHARPEEGSEHYFAYYIENELGKGLPHGSLVGPGILIMAALQGQETALLESALRTCNIPLTDIPKDIIGKTLRELPAYCRAHPTLPYGIAHTLTPDTIKQWRETHDD